MPAHVRTDPPEPTDGHPTLSLANRRRLAVGLVATVLAVPVVVIDNLPTGPRAAQAVEVVAPATTPPTEVEVEVTVPTTAAPPTTAAALRAAAPTTTATTATTVATTATTAARPTTTTTAPRPTTTAPPPPTTATTVPPTTATTAPPAPPPAAGSVEAIIRSWFGAAGDEAVAVARCESSLNPSARNGSSYFGLFQLSAGHAANFAAVTGRSFDDAWDEAGPNSQYARYLYDRQGWSAWGACAP